MANEFIIKHGFLSKGNSQVTGSLGISGSIDIEIPSGSAFIINEGDAPGSFLNRLDFHFDNKNPVLEVAARQAQSTFILSQDANAIQTSFTNQGLITYKVQAGTNYGVQLGPQFKPNTTNQQDLGNYNRRWKNLYLYASNKISWGTVNDTDLVALQNFNTTNTLQVTGSSDVILDVKGVVSASKFTANSGSSAALPGYSFHHASGTGLYSQAAGYLQLQVNGGGSPEFELTTGQSVFRVPIQLSNNELINPSRIRGLGSITGSTSGNNLGVSSSLDLDGDLSISKTTGTGAPGTGTTHSIAVTVSNPGSGNKYYLDNVLTDSIVMNAGDAYKFDQSAASNSTHPFRLSTGTDGSGTAPYEVGVTYGAGSPGNANAYTQISVTTSTTAPLYYYCTAHPGMGGSGQLTVDSGSLNTLAGFASITGSLNVTGSTKIIGPTRITGSLYLGDTAAGSGLFIATHNGYEVKYQGTAETNILSDTAIHSLVKNATGHYFGVGGTSNPGFLIGQKASMLSSTNILFDVYDSTFIVGRGTTGTGISQITGSLYVTGSISASGDLISNRLLLGGGTFTSASLAAGGGGNTFPFAGDGVISGSLLISSSNVGGISTASMTLQGSGSTIFDIQGSQGQLFSVTDDLIHEVFNVSDISGDTLLKVSGSGLVEIPVGPISSSGLLFISASENAGQNTYKTLVQDPATGRIYHTGSYGTGGGSGGGDTYDLNATQDGSNVDLNLTSTSGNDNSVVQLTAGANITLTRNSATEVTIASSGGSGGGEWKDLGTTITSSKDVQITGSLIASGSVVNFASASSVLLPAETVPLINPKVEYLTISEITASGTTVPLPNSLTFVSSSTFEYLEIFINGLRLRYNIDFTPMSTSTIKYLTTIPSGSEVTYKSLRR